MASCRGDAAKSLSIPPFWKRARYAGLRAGSARKYGGMAVFTPCRNARHVPASRTKKNPSLERTHAYINKCGVCRGIGDDLAAARRLFTWQQAEASVRKTRKNRRRRKHVPTPEGVDGGDAGSTDGGGGKPRVLARRQKNRSAEKLKIGEWKNRNLPPPLVSCLSVRTFHFCRCLIFRRQLRYSPWNSFLFIFWPGD